MFAEVMGRKTGLCQGKGGSMHLFDVSRRFYGGNAIVGGGLPIAAGLALADLLQQRSVVTACFFGEGEDAEGEFHESCNLAALWKLPVLFLCENNLYAMGTALDRSEADTNLCDKAASYRMRALTVDGMDVLAVRATMREALAHVRGGGGPVFVEFRTYRFRAHSMFDPELYRSKAEVEEWKKRCPIAGFTRRVQLAGLLSEADVAAIERDVAAEVAAAVEFAAAGTWEPVEDLTKDVYARPPVVFGE
jgi:TPP-dependent pyruvate/acetoin dehydrogenase alpha subunit